MQRIIQNLARVTVTHEPSHRYAADAYLNRRQAFLVARDDIFRHEVAHCIYNLENGQIGRFWIDENFQHRGLATELLKKCAADLKARGVPGMWGVTSNKNFVNMKAFQGQMSVRDPDGVVMKL